MTLLQTVNLSLLLLVNIVLYMSDVDLRTTRASVCSGLLQFGDGIGMKVANVEEVFRGSD